MTRDPFRDALRWWMEPGLLSMPPADMAVIGMCVIVVIYAVAGLAR